MRPTPLSAHPPRPRGAILVVALLITAMIALTLGSYLSLNLGNSRLARRSHQQTAAFHLAEAGAEEAVWSLNRTQAQAPDAWTGWTIHERAASRKFSDFNLGSGATGSVKVYVTNTHPAAGAKPMAVTLATVESVGLSASTRMIELTLGRRSYFSNGIVARETVKFSGSNVTVDSWNSDPDANPATAPVAYGEGVRNDRGSIATAAVENKSMLVNHAAVWGHVSTGGAAPEVGTDGSIRGADTPPDVKIDPARVTTDFVIDLPLLNAPVDGTPIPSVGDTLGTSGQATKWRCPSIALNGNQTLTILGDVTLVLTATVGSALDVTGKAAIIIPPGSSLTLYAEADLKIAGNGLANANPHPASCNFFGTNPSPGGQSIHVAGNGALKAAIYAPHGDIQVNGNGDVMGSIVGHSVTFTGNAHFHYDEALANAGDNTPFKVTRWRELTDPSDRAAWQPVFAGW